MPIKIRYALTLEEREAIYRLRYQIYIEEIGYRFPADHVRKLLPDPGDRNSRLLMALDEERVVGTARFDWGGDGPFSDDEVEIYELPRFSAAVGLGGLAVFSRFMVAPSHRSGEVPSLLFDEVIRFLLERDVPLLFLDCRPHLISSYERLGFRTYAKTYSDPAAGLLVPLVLVLDDRGHLRRVGARWLPLFEVRAANRERLRILREILPDYSPVHTLSNPEGAAADAIQPLLEEGRSAGQITVFENLSDADVATLVGASHVIECQLGDRIIAEHVTDQTVFLVLEGVVEVRKDGKVLAVLGPGAVFGEIAFLLQGRRTADVFAAVAGVRILALRQKALTQLIESESAMAARFLLNLARILCVKLAGGRLPG